MRAIEHGRITVNGETTVPHYLLRNGDIFSHLTHRHEPPVTAEQLALLHEDDGLIVINKPSSIPV